MTRRNGNLCLTVLASGSSGNSLVIHHRAGAVLLDAGISARQVALRMEAADLDPASLQGIVVTHEHSDHSRGVRVLAQRLTCPVYASAGTIRSAGLDAMALDTRPLSAGDRVEVGGIEVRAFDTSHDAAEPLGCAFESPRGQRIGIVTDTGEVTASARDAIAECDVVGVECNHDERMLAEGPYPAFLKQRILSSAGHLSNGAAATEIRRFASGRLRALVALHVSKTNNTPARALEAVRGALGEAGSTADVACASEQAVPLGCDCASGLVAPANGRDRR